MKKKKKPQQKNKIIWFYWVPKIENWESSNKSPKEPQYSHSKIFGSGTINIYFDKNGYYWAQFS